MKIQIKKLALDCGIDCSGMTVQRLKEVHDSLMHPDYVDQFDVRLMEALTVGIKVNPEMVL